MASLFSSLKRGLASGHRSGKAAKIIQNVLGRPLGPNELKAVQRWGERRNYSDEVDEYDFAVDYFFALMEGIDLPKVPPDAASWIIDCAVRAINNGTLYTRQDSQKELIQYFEKHRVHKEDHPGSFQSNQKIDEERNPAIQAADPQPFEIPKVKLLCSFCGTESLVDDEYTKTCEFCHRSQLG